MVEQEVKLETVDKFLRGHEVAFDTPAKKAVFLEGVLVKFLLDVQYANRKSTPFRGKLHGLKLDVIKIRKLLPEIVEKLREYKVGCYSWLERLVSQYFIDAENEGWDLSKDEISYYFALGLNLGGILKQKEDNINGGNENG